MRSILFALASVTLGCSTASNTPPDDDGGVGGHDLIACDASLAVACAPDGEASDTPPDDGGVGGPGLIACDVSLALACAPDGGEACPPPLAASLPGPWCASSPRAGAIRGACGGYDVLPVGVGTDEILLFMYPADGGSLAAVLAASDAVDVTCIGGAPEFGIAASCFGDDPDQLLNAFSGTDAGLGCAGFDAGGGLAPADGGGD